MDKIKNMDKTKKKKIKRIIALACVAVVIVVLAAMPLIAKQDPDSDRPKASILSDTVSFGNIDTELIGGGTLAEEDAVTLSVPAAVKLKEFLVVNGDTVKEGTAIASVDRVTVMTAITQIQETLEYLSQQIEEASEQVASETLTALAGGTVKILYAKKGASVESVMLEHGALAVLSLDGLMAVDLETESKIPTGTPVTLTLSNGKSVSGKVAKNLAGEMTVTVEDKDYPVGEGVAVTDQEGEGIGSGKLYIYSPWNATAYAGTVSTVKVQEGDKLDAGDKLMVIKDVGYSATYRQLIGQRQVYEEMMLELFKMYQTETIVAPCDGVVSGIDKNSIQLLTAKEQSYVLTFLANAPNGDDQTLYSNYVGKVTAVATNGWMMDVNPQGIAIADYMDLSQVSVDETLMTQTVLHTQIEIPMYTLTDGAWTQVDAATIGAGDTLLFASDTQGNLVWSVLIKKAEQLPENPGEPTEPGESPQPDTSTQPTTPPSNSNGSTNRPQFNYPSGGNGFGNVGGVIEPEPEYELYGLEVTQVAAVTPQSAVTLDITIDELDVAKLQVGMTGQIQVDALGGEKYTATITEIGNSGTNNGGNSKYTVELTMERGESMLVGMNATATIVLSTANQVLTIPVDALVEKGNQTVVYTGYDAKSDTLLDPVAVKVGKSDGETAEILEGLTHGQTYYYAYYDTLEVSATPDFGSGFRFK